MKMSDVFYGEVGNFGGGSIGDDRCDEFALAEFEDTTEADYACHAINNHDRLTEENEKLQADYDSLDKQAKQWLNEYKSGVEVAKKLREENEKLRDALKGMIYEYAYVCGYVECVPESYEIPEDKWIAHSRLNLIELMVQLLEQTK